MRRTLNMAESKLQRINAMTISNDQLKRIIDLADTILDSNLSYKKPNKDTELSASDLIMIMLEGAEIGLSPIQSLKALQVIAGKISISPQGMLGLVWSSGLLDNITIDSREDECRIIIMRHGIADHTEVFTKKDAERLGLLGKDNYRKQLRVMLKWRCVAAALRTMFPDIVLGLYTQDELGATVYYDESTGEALQVAEHTQKSEKVIQYPQPVENSPEEYAQVDEEGDVVIPQEQLEPTKGQVDPFREILDSNVFFAEMAAIGIVDDNDNVDKSLIKELQKACGYEPGKWSPDYHAAMVDDIAAEFIRRQTEEERPYESSDDPIPDEVQETEDELSSFNFG